MNGVVIVNKPKGKTSHDVVGMMRKRFGTRRVGHTGTLDPLATGVLPVLIGTATKAADMLIKGDKKYRATMLLGKRTDTLDIEGAVISESEVNVTESEVRAVIESFIGESMQIPPMYSAIKQNGKKLYDLARSGVEVEREARKIHIYSIDIVDISIPRIVIDVHCSKGTYIRSLCDDIGQKLGTGAIMTDLVRTQTADFTLDKSYTIEELDELSDLSVAVLPTDSLFMHLPAIILNEKQEKSIVNGVRMTWRDGTEGQSYRLYSNDGRFLCISRIEEMKLVLEKAFWI